MSIDELRKEYHALIHAMQTGVEYCMNKNISQETTAKHLRVGVNSCMCETSVLLDLLLLNGLTTEQQFLELLNDRLKEEVRSYEKRLSEHFGKPIKLL